MVFHPEMTECHMRDDPFNVLSYNLQNNIILGVSQFHKSCFNNIDQE